MGNKVTLFCFVALLLWGICHARPAGVEFAMAFMQNFQNNLTGSQFLIHISGLHNDTKVIVKVRRFSFVEEHVLQAGKGVTVAVPPSVGMYGSQKSANTVVIEASKEVTVGSFNYKNFTSDTSVVYPVSAWGMEYVVFTPPLSPPGTLKEISVTNYKETNIVDVFPVAAVNFDGQLYNPGSKITIQLAPYESAQLQSNYNLSGSVVSSKLPVAVTSGHTCTWTFTRCDHVYEQLLPVKSWGKSFIVPSLSIQSQYDSIYIQASQNTSVTVQTKEQLMKAKMSRGQTTEFRLSPPNAFYITSDNGIQVFYLFNGVILSGGKMYDPFLMTILPSEHFCTAYTINGQDNFKNTALFVAHTKDVTGFKLDGSSMPTLQWKVVKGTEYSWAELSFTQKAEHHTVANPRSSFAVYSIGMSQTNGYGAPALCSSLGTDEKSCKNTICSADEMCHMRGPTPLCLKKEKSTCWAHGDPHYNSFDGHFFDFMGTCSYVMARNCKSMPEFNVETQTNNLGSSHVSHVASVTINVHNVTITMVRFETGHVRIDNTVWSLPVHLDNGRVSLFQRSHSVVMETDFGLTVKYDWNHNLAVTLPAKYMNKVCGLCGNFNGDPRDDFAMPNGSLATTASSFVQSWKVSGLGPDAPCRDDCEGKCEKCDHKMMSEWKGENFCGILTNAVNGPFRECHSVIKPEVYFRNCVYDMCVSDGLRLYMCYILEAYAQSCQSAGAKINNWREISQCSPHCPENSHYELCGNACPATCYNHNSPSKCDAPCLESCTCNDGYVLSADKCVLASHCGCSYAGRYVPSGEFFWADQECHERCYCTAASVQLMCSREGCQLGEKCKITNGIRDCQPISMGICIAMGDMHYVTFDGQYYDFQGTCVYQLVGRCSSDPALVDFQVNVQNEGVSFTKLVKVNVYNMSIIISKEYPGQVMVNNELVNLPVYVDGVVSVFKSGMSALIKTKFNLMVSFDWKSRIEVILPSTYAGAVCGLCGNFNHKPQDDLMLGGNTSSSISKFGSSWQVDQVPGCVHNCVGDCPTCDAALMKQYETASFCGLLRDPKGPFRNCHSEVDPISYFKNCAFDVCVYKGRQDVLCQAITAYVSACQASGVKVHAWRSLEFCHKRCPANSHYVLCAMGCPDTCHSLSPPRDCTEMCKEDCMCNDGYVLSGSECVPLSQCGCVYNDKYYNVGEVFYPCEKCLEECTCVQYDKVKCKPYSCGPNEKCMVENGVRRCHADSIGLCLASGDAHYRSFDGLLFDFQGTCTYILAKACGLNATRLVPFSVQVKTRKLFPSCHNSLTRLVSLEVYGYTLVLQHDTVGVVVNKALERLPLNLNKSAIVVYQDGWNYVIRTDFGLVVTYDQLLHVTLTIPSNYQNMTSGLCGNFNRDKGDDIQVPNGSLAKDVISFGAAWKVVIPGVECEDGCPEGSCPTCMPEHRAVFERANYCGIMTAPQGPFSRCHSKINPTPFFNDCMYDLCASNGDLDVLCSMIRSYVYRCQAAGASIESWRSVTFCPPTCEANSHYEICTHTCTTACPGVTELAKCSKTCSEGCACDLGFLFNGKTCVQHSQCGCFENGHTYMPGKEVYMDDCQKKCTCDPVRGLLCKTFSCPTETSCLIRNGVKGCYHTDPCRDAKCKAQEKCVLKDNVAKCEPQCSKICSVWGDGHYKSFDGLKYNFRGKCSYTFSRSCGSLDGLVPFSVEQKNYFHGTSTYVQSVTVSVYGFIFSIDKNQEGHVKHDGKIVNIPLYMKGDLVTLTQKGTKIAVETDFGLKVSYDWHSELEVILPSSYQGLVCGMCGNYNGNSSDDMQSPSGDTFPSVTPWIKSWRVIDPEDPTCMDQCEGVCNRTCDDEKLYLAENLCGALTQHKVFKPCHTDVTPDDYRDNCAHDMCFTKGDKKTLCLAITAYSDTCRHEGVVLDNWREIFGCPLRCQPNSHYEACTTPCQPSCPFPNKSLPCPGTCVEACQCDKGFVLSAGKCVPVDNCGCSYQGKYYKPNESFWLDKKCQHLCQCVPELHTMVCRDASCGLGEHCALKAGVHRCYPTTFSTCTVSGSSHYQTFDNHHYSFQGSCVYQLTALCSRHPHLQPFNVTVQNGHRGCRAVSHAYTVTVELQKVNVSFSREQPGKILLNGELTFLPLHLDDETVKVFLSGSSTVLETNFGLQMSINWNGQLKVTLPSPYQDAVCGLCGNFNGNATDDLTMADGQMAPNETTFGGSWLTRLLPGCSPVCSDPECQRCSEAQKKNYRNKRHCGIIADQHGPVATCHKHVKPQSYLEDCTFDACVYKGHPSIISDSVTSYVSDCQDKGVTLQPWRNNSFFPFTCPRNSHYELCSSACPDTCASPSSGTCNLPCHEACQCNEGFLLSGDVCVPLADCGCSYGERYYKKNETFYTTACDNICTCGDNGAVTCSPSKCQPGETCHTVGTLGCHPTRWAKCVVSGGPHYVTFDGKHYDFQGTCVYILVKVCDERAQVVPFTVEVANRQCTTTKVAFTREVSVKVYGYVITIKKGTQWRVSVDNELMMLPLSVEGGRIRVQQQGGHISLQTDFGLSVLYDTVHYVEVMVPSTYHGHVCGLCGNYNGDSGDDLLMPKGKVHKNVDVFGAAWAVDTPTELCAGCGVGCPKCTPKDEGVYGGSQYCGIISDPQGPFRACHTLLDPQAYRTHCVYDVCVVKGAADTLCNSIKAYATACQHAGANILTWRNSSFCPLSCPAHSHYQLCADTCNYTCAILVSAVSCKTHCFEGCQCDAGYVFDGDECVSMAKCGCMYDGRYLKTGEVMVDRRCESRCQCQASRAVVCETLQCAKGQTCSVKNGQRNCHHHPAQCEITHPGTLVTYDGLSGPAGRDGALEMSTLCEQNSGLWFRLVVELSTKANLKTVTKLHFFCNDTYMMVNCLLHTWVNGRRETVSRIMKDELSLHMSDEKVSIKKSSELHISYTVKQQLSVSVSTKLSGKVCGACGNYNNVSQDDLVLPNGTTVATAAQLVDYWKPEDFSSCNI